MLKKDRFIAAAAFLTLAMSTAPLIGQPPSEQPKPVPADRTEMKERLELLKAGQPRLPVPLGEAAGAGGATVNNARARQYFLPNEWFAGERRGLGGSSDELVDYALKTKCFWVVSRGNNCHYCLGHQEHKLHMVGLDDDAIAALDHDWDSLDSRTRKALELARKMTLRPHELSSHDVEALRPEFDDPQIIELVYTIARFNATNRWTDAMGLPQDSEMRGQAISFLTPTSERWSDARSLASPDAGSERPLPSAEEVEKGLKAASRRTPYVELPPASQAREKLELPQGEPVTDWHRAMAALVSSGPSTVANFEAMMTHEELSPTLKAQLLHRTAMLNRAWASLASARSRLESLGAKPLGPDAGGASEAERAAIQFAGKLTCRPHTISDADVAALREHFSDRQVAQIIHVVATGNALDRFTETLGLRMEPAAAN